MSTPAMVKGSRKELQRAYVWGDRTDSEHPRGLWLHDNFVGLWGLLLGIVLEIYEIKIISFLGSCLVSHVLWIPSFLILTKN